MKLRLLVGILLMEIILGLKVTMNQVTKKNLILVVFQICDSCFNAKTTKYVYLRFFLDFWFLQLLSHFLFFLEARSKE